MLNLVRKVADARDARPAVPGGVLHHVVTVAGLLYAATDDEAAADDSKADLMFCVVIQWIDDNRLPLVVHDVWASRQEAHVWAMRHIPNHVLHVGDIDSWEVCDLHDTDHFIGMV